MSEDPGIFSGLRLLLLLLWLVWLLWLLLFWGLSLEGGVGERYVVDGGSPLFLFAAVGRKMVVVLSWLTIVFSWWFSCWVFSRAVPAPQASPIWSINESFSC